MTCSSMLRLAFAECRVFILVCHHTWCRYAGRHSDECHEPKWSDSHCCYAGCPYTECGYAACRHVKCNLTECLHVWYCCNDCHYARCRLIDCFYIECHGTIVSVIGHTTMTSVELTPGGIGNTLTHTHTHKHTHIYMYVCVCVCDLWRNKCNYTTRVALAYILKLWNRLLGDLWVKRRELSLSK